LGKLTFAEVLKNKTNKQKTPGIINIAIFILHERLFKNQSNVTIKSTVSQKQAIYITNNTEYVFRETNKQK